MTTKELRAEKIKNKRQTEKRSKNNKIKLQQITFNFYIPTDTENINQKVKIVNISIVDGKTTS